MGIDQAFIDQNIINNLAFDNQNIIQFLELTFMAIIKVHIKAILEKLIEFSS